MPACKCIQDNMIKHQQKYVYPSKNQHKTPCRLESKQRWWVQASVQGNIQAKMITIKLIQQNQIFKQRLIPLPQKHIWYQIFPVYTSDKFAVMSCSNKHDICYDESHIYMTFAIKRVKPHDICYIRVTEKMLSKYLNERHARKAGVLPGFPILVCVLVSLRLVICFDLPVEDIDEFNMKNWQIECV